MNSYDDDEWDIEDDGYWDFDEVSFRVFMKFRHMLSWGATGSGRETIERFTEMNGEHILNMSFDRYNEIIEDHDARISNNEPPLWQQDFDHDIQADADDDL
jgi:hypothetical protein